MITILYCARRSKVLHQCSTSTDILLAFPFFPFPHWVQKLLMTRMMLLYVVWVFPSIVDGQSAVTTLKPSTFRLLIDCEECRRVITVLFASMMKSGCIEVEVMLRRTNFY